MSISRRLAAHRQALASAAPEAADPPPAAPSGVAENEDETHESEPEKELDMTEEELNAAKAAEREAGFAAANARFNTVLASEHYEGREALAKTLLGNAKLDAEDITAALAAAPKALPAASDGDDDAAARAELRDGLAAEQPANTTEASADELEASAPDTSLVDGMKARFNLK